MVRLLNEIAAAGAESMMQARPRLVAVDPPSEGGRRWAIMGLYVAVFTLFGGVIWYAYQETMGGAGEPPLIRAEAAPYKRAPDTPGGMDIENEHSTLASRAFGNNREPKGMERILPRESVAPRKIEALDPLTTTAAVEPVAAPSRPTDGARVVAPSATTGTATVERLQTTDNAKQAAALSPAPGLTNEAQAALAQPLIEPAAGPATNAAARARPGAPPASQVDRETLERLLADTAAAPTAAPSRAGAIPTAGAAERAVPQVYAGLPPSMADRVPARAGEATPPAATRSIADPAVVPPAGQVGTTTPPPANRTAAIDPAAPSTTVGRATVIEPAAAPPTTGVSPQGQWALQFAALGSPEAGNKAWEQLRAKHPELFNQLSRRMSPVTTAAGATLYRLLGAGFDDRNAAARACVTLKAGGTDCLVVAAGR